MTFFKNNKLFGKSSLFGRSSLFSGNSLFPAFSDLPIAEMSERYFSSGGIVDNEVVNPYGDNAQLVKSYCASFNGTSSACALGTALDMTGDWTILIDFIVGSVTSGYIISELTTDTEIRRFFIFITGGNRIGVQIGTNVAGTAGAGVNITSIANVTGGRYLIKLKYDSSLQKLYSYVKHPNDTVEQYEFNVEGLTITNQTWNIGKAPVGGYFNGKIIKIGIWYDQKDLPTLLDIDDDCEFAVVYQGSIFDLTGSRTISYADITFSRQNFYHYNILNGFDYYLDTATGLVPLYVPYVNGAPVVSSVSGYTKQSSNPAGKWHNQAETYVRFPAGSIFDKSDVDNWSADLRALATYDSSNPTDWAGYELSPAYFQTYWTGAKNMIFSASDYNEYVYLDGIPSFDDTNEEMYTYAEDKTSVREILVYASARTKNTIISIVNWIKSKVGVGI